MKSIRLFVNALFILCFVLLVYPMYAQIDFSVEEKDWLTQHDSIVFAVDNTYPPLNFVDNTGKLTGLNVELIELVGKKIGIEIILEGSNWDVALNKAMNHKVDGIINAAALEERKQKLHFSDGFFRDPLALIIHQTNNNISKPGDINNQTIAVKKNSKHAKLLLAKYPNIKIVTIPTLMDGVGLLARGKVDGVYDDLAPLYHLLSSSNLNNLKVAFVEENQEESMIGIRNDDFVLLSIINKGISALSEKEKKTIQNRWLSFTPERDYTNYYITIAILTCFLLIFGLWSWSLKIIVNKKTYELSQELKQREITEKALRKAKEKAVESDKLKSAFLANMSHEIRTPLNAIVGFSGLLIADDLTAQEKSNHYNIIVSSSSSLLSLINDIVDFSKIEAGYLETNITAVPLVSVLTNLQAIYGFEIEKLIEKDTGDLTFELVLDEQFKHIVLNTDLNRLKQVFAILINNAIKFTTKGKIIVGVDSCNATMIQLFVQDTGIGIAKANCELIFDRFRKIEDNNDNLYRGAGLGLSIAKHLVELMNGSITVDSTLGVGSKFCFTMPIIST